MVTKRGVVVQMLASGLVLALPWVAASAQEPAAVQEEAPVRTVPISSRLMPSARGGSSSALRTS